MYSYDISFLLLSYSENPASLNKDSRQSKAQTKSTLSILALLSGETSKFTTESHKMLQGDVFELFLWFLRHLTKSHYYHLSVVSDYYRGLYRQPRQFCETSTEVPNYLIVFCETMWKPGAADILTSPLTDLILLLTALVYTVTISNFYYDHIVRTQPR